MNYLTTNKRNLSYLIIFVLLLLVILIIHGCQSKDTHAENSNAVLLSRDDVAPVKQGIFAIRLPVSGVLYPLQQTTIIAKVSGEIASVNVREGDVVVQNQVMAQLDTADLIQALADKNANLAAKQATYKLSVTTMERNKKLLEKKYVSQNDYDSAMNQMEVNAAAVKQAQAAYDEAKLQLNYATIKSVIPGRVSERIIDPGVNVNVGTMLFKVVNLDTLEFKAIVPADDINKIAVGQETVLHVSGVKKSLRGKVARINPSSISGTRAFYTYIDIDNRGHQLLDGMFALGTIITVKHENALSIPYEAIRSDAKGHYVYSIQDNQLRKKYVTIGLTDVANNSAEIVQGLNPGTQIVASSIEIEDGMKVILPESSHQAAK